MSRDKKKTEKEASWLQVAGPVLFLAAFTVLIVLQRGGFASDINLPADIPEESEFSTPVAAESTECLLVTDRSDAQTVTVASEMRYVLKDMRVSYIERDISDVNVEKDTAKVQSVVLALQDWDGFGSDIGRLMEWVQNGGSLMCAMTPEPAGNFMACRRYLGIEEGGGTYTGITGIQAASPSVIGYGNKRDYPFHLADGETMMTSLAVRLDDEAKVLFTSSDGQVPLLWSIDYGEGRFAVINDVISDKFQRGFYCIAYSSLSDMELWPVINASAFYLDDFPAPVPGGTGMYIERDYGISTSAFYSSIWWPQMLDWEEKYGIRHTGMLIEDYNDNTRAPFKKQKSTSRFLTFGNTLIYHDGEIGIHGYNHQPLCLEGVDEDMQYGSYKLWHSPQDVYLAVQEVKGFAESVFPDRKFQVYVPPSNILSENGKELLLSADPDIRAIASVYTRSASSPVFAQEYSIEDNGIIDTPRIASGEIIGDYMYLTALGEMNYHFVQSHFCHPDDVLDADRGASYGWPYMAKQFETYLQYVTGSAPSMRQTTGSEMAAAVERYAKLSMNVKRKENELDVTLGGFNEEAWFLLRVNEGELGETEGCTAEQAADHLYLIHAASSHLVLKLM